MAGKTRVRSHVGVSSFFASHHHWRVRRRCTAVKRTDVQYGQEKCVLSHHHQAWWHCAKETKVGAPSYQQQHRVSFLVYYCASRSDTKLHHSFETTGAYLLYCMPTSIHMVCLNMHWRWYIQPLLYRAFVADDEDDSTPLSCNTEKDRHRLNFRTAG